MRLEVERIKDKEIELEEQIPASVWDMNSFDVKFVNNIHTLCRFLRAGKEIIVKAKVTTHRMIICSRCLEEVGQFVSQEFNLSYEISRLGDYLEVDKDLREEILLNFPMKVLCRPDCKGICPKCGANLNRQECKCQKIKNQKLKAKNTY